MLTTIACSRANSQVERINRTILNALRGTDPNEATNIWANCLPFDFMFTRGTKPRLDVSTIDQPSEPAEVRRRKVSAQLKNTSDKMEQNFDKKLKPTQIYKKADLVLWK